MGPIEKIGGFMQSYYWRRNYVWFITWSGGWRVSEIIPSKWRLLPTCSLPWEVPFFSIFLLEILFTNCSVFIFSIYSFFLSLYLFLKMSLGGKKHSVAWEPNRKKLVKDSSHDLVIAKKIFLLQCSLLLFENT